MIEKAKLISCSRKLTSQTNVDITNLKTESNNELQNKLAPLTEKKFPPSIHQFQIKKRLYHVKTQIIY